MDMIKSGLFSSATVRESLPTGMALQSMPIESPVLVFAIAMIVFLVGPLAIKRLGQPGIVGILLLGAFLGPGGFGIVEHVDAIQLLGTVGLIYLLFTVGLELDLQGLKDSPQDATLFGLLSFTLPFLVGIVVCIEVLGLEVWASVLLSAVFSSHTLLAFPIVDRYGVTRNDAVTAVFGGILFTDTLALVVLAVAVDAVEVGLGVGVLLEVALALSVLFVGLWLLVPVISRWFFRTFDEESYFEFLFVMVVLFVAAGAAELLELAPILGAFVAGIAMNRLITVGGPLRNRIEFVGNALFIPFFLIHVGMLVDFAVLTDGVSTLTIAAVISLTMFVMKAVGAGVFARLRGLDTNELGTIIGLSTGQAAAALAIALVGFDVGLFDEEILNAVVLLLLISAVVSPLLTERYATRLALSKELASDDDQIEDPTVLLPLSHYDEPQRRLLELAFLFKAEETTTPVHVLTVVRPGDGTDETVAEVRTQMEAIREVGAEAEVPIETETRINRNIATGIVRGATEVEADIIQMGWDARSPSFGQRIFGTVIDRILDSTRLPVIITRLEHPIATTEQLYLVLPSDIAHHEGFFEALHYGKKTADRAGADLIVLSVGNDAEEYERLVGLVEPELPIEIHTVGTWFELHEYLDEETDGNDLIAAITPRRGGLGWSKDLENLPQSLADHPPETFMVIHPREGDPQYDRRFLQFK